MSWRSTTHWGRVAGRNALSAELMAASGTVVSEADAPPAPVQVAD
jgi:hypothetical protein